MTTPKKYSLFIMLLLAPLAAVAQWAEPAKFTVTHKAVGDKEIVITFKGTIEQGWHVYSTDVGEGGPTPATFNIDEAKGLRPIGKLRALTKAKRSYDEIFGRELSFHEGSCIFEQHMAVTAPEYSLKGYLEYGACNDHSCTPPTAVEVAFKGALQPKGEEAPSPPKGEEAPQPPKGEETLNSQFSNNYDSILWASRVDKIKALNRAADNELPSTVNGQWAGAGWLWLFLMGFVGGLIAVLTPCVWPIIPMTVSFFLKRNSKNEKLEASGYRLDKPSPETNSQFSIVNSQFSKNKGIRDALLYGLSIIVIYMLLAVVVTLLMGADALNSLSTNAVANIFFFVMLVAFGLSFMGFFELQLPSSWSNKADSKADSTTGVLSIFIMAFTLALVSFSCTGPIVGFMLVEVATMGNLMGPLMCMLGFAVALALPFTLFAMFPAMLKKAPKSGRWMNTLKVVLGFVEVAFAFKFLSVADMAYGWHLLSRDVFIVIWIMLAVVLALWLLGVVRLPIDGGAKSRRTPVRICLAMVCLAFAAYMVPGVLGKPLKAISAFAPPMSTQHLRYYGEVVEAQFTDYDEGMAYARKHNKNVLLDFTGYGCVNCREMEMNVWNDPEVAKLLREDLVLISLFVDDKTALPQRIEVDDNGRTTTLRTVGSKWSYLQRRRFGANVQPFYVLVSPNGEPLKAPYSYDTDVEKFIRFLNVAEND